MLIVFSFFFTLHLHATAAAPALAASPTDPIIAEATAMGYIIERSGVVLTENTECSVVTFGLENWLNSRAFPADTRKFANTSGVKEYDALATIKDVTLDYFTSARSLFANLTGQLPEWKEPYKTTTLNFTVPKPAHHIVDTFEFHDVTGILQPVLKMMLRARLNRVADAYKLQLRSVLAALHRKTLDHEALYLLGGEEFFLGLSKEVLGNQYSGSLIEQFGARLSRLTRIELLGRVGAQSLAVKICLPNLHRSQGLPMYVVRPWGALEGDVYRRPNLPLYYAQGDESDSVNELLVAEDVLFSRDGVTVVTRLRNQERGCRLITPSKCYWKRTHLSANVTLLLPLNEKTLIVTHEKTAGCVFEGDILKPFPVLTPMFVRDTHDIGGKECMLQVGKKTVGDQIVSHILRPDPLIVWFDPAKDVRAWEKNEEWKALIRSLVLPTFLVLFFVAIVIALVVVGCKIRKNRKVADEALANCKKIVELL